MGGFLWDPTCGDEGKCLSYRVLPGPGEVKHHAKGSKGKQFCFEFTAKWFDHLPALEQKVILS